MSPGQRSPGASSSLALVGSAFAAIYLIWGSTYLAVRWAVEAIPPLLLMGSRAVIAGVVLLGWSALRGRSLPGRREWAGAALVGAFLFLGAHGLVAWGETRVPSGPAAILVATIPLWMTLLEGAVEERRIPGGRRAGAVVVGYAGVALLVLPDPGGTAPPVDRIGAGALLLAAFLWSAGSILSRRVRLPDSTASRTGAQLLAGGLLLLCAAFFLGEPGRLSLAGVEARHWASFAFLIVFGSLIAFSAYTYLLRASTPTRVASYAYVNPVIAVFIGAAAGDGRLDARTLLACLLTALGVAGLVAARSRSEAGPRRHALGGRGTPCPDSG